MDKFSEKKEIIEELLDKGYSYVNICCFLANKGILGKKGFPLTKTGIVYYIKKYGLKLKKKAYIDLQYLCFEKDRYYCLIDKTFSPLNAESQIWKIKKMKEFVEKCSSILPREEYEINLKNYKNVVSMLENKKHFKVYNKRIRGDYPGRNLLAIVFKYKNETVILPKKDIFNWMREHDQFILYSQSDDIYVKGIMQNENIVCSFDDNLVIDNFLKYIYTPAYNSSEFVMEQVCSEEAFKIAILKKGKWSLADIRVKGEIKTPKFSLSDEELCRKMKGNTGIEPLRYSDMEYVSRLYECLGAGY